MSMSKNQSKCQNTAFSLVEIQKTFHFFSPTKIVKFIYSEKVTKLGRNLTTSFDAIRGAISAGPLTGRLPPHSILQNQDKTSVLPLAPAL